jgi:chromate transporter
MSGYPEKVGLFDVFRIYLKLGCLSFGGPVAHIGYFKEEFVNRRSWLDEAQYTELLGLCQFVPGPSSSQLGFAIGWHRAGLLGACCAWLGFTLPSTLIMFGSAYGLFALGGYLDSFIAGLLIAAVAVVVHATWSLGTKLCPDRPRILIAALAAVIVTLSTSAFAQIIVIIIGALLGLRLRPEKQTTQAPAGESRKAGRELGTTIILTALALYAALLGASLIMSADSPGGLYALHYRAGALVFGGGHVVLPLLNDSVVAGGLVSEDQFLAGYSAAQALPGPLFTLSAFVGTVSESTHPLWLGGLGALIAIFLPGMLLLVGLLPFWGRVRERGSIQAALRGANAAVVGLLLAVLIDPVWVHGIGSVTDAMIGLVALLALARFKAPPWGIVLSCGLAGHLLSL